jgi:uncharacterized membrane protein SpoIIM required for sporulation
VILDIERFLAAERPLWDELESRLRRMEDDAAFRPGIADLRRLHYLYERASAGLARLATFASQPEIRSHLESLVSRAYGEIHETRLTAARLAPWRYLTVTFPQAFRRRRAAFAAAVACVLAGALFGGLALLLDDRARDTLLPYDHLRLDPATRVAREEGRIEDELKGSRGGFAAFLSTHNTRVAIFCLALGVTWGVGTAILLFSNGVLLGAVAVDYVRAGQSAFLVGWLLPHGAVEIPAFVMAGQAGLLLAGALIGWGDREPLRPRLRRAGPDLMALTAGIAVLLLWAGLVESFLSQYHEPVVDYPVKIAFGVAELIGLALFLWRAGRRG